MDILVEVARTAKQLDAVAATGHEVYGHEMGLHEFIDEKRKRLLFDPAEPAIRFAAIVDGQVVGSVSVLEGRVGPFPAELYRGLGMGRFASVVGVERMVAFTRFFVRREHRAAGVPFALIEASVRHAAATGAHAAFLDCQPHLLNLYLALGAQPHAPTWDQPGFGLMVPLVYVPDRAHFHVTRSPLLPLLEDWFDDDVAARLRPLLAMTPPVVAAESPQAWSALHGLLTLDDRPHLLAGLSEEQVAELIHRGHMITTSRGERVVASGQGAKTVYVVLDGVLEVRDGDVPLAVLSAGDVVGETAFLLDMPRTRDVVAASDKVRLLALSDRVVRELIEGRSVLAAQLLLNLARVLAQRLAGG